MRLTARNKRLSLPLSLSLSLFLCVDPPLRFHLRSATRLGRAANVSAAHRRPATLSVVRSVSRSRSSSGIAENSLARRYVNLRPFTALGNRYRSHVRAFADIALRSARQVFDLIDSVVTSRRIISPASFRGNCPGNPAPPRSRGESSLLRS